MISALRWETSLTQHINQSHSARLQASTVRELSCVPTASDASSSAPGVQTVHGVLQALLQIVRRLGARARHPRERGEHRIASLRRYAAH
jgi:hypothetical protein